MLDLNEQPNLPRYELKLPGGETKSYDPLVLGFALRCTEGVEDPVALQKAVNEAFELDVDTYHACIILKDFIEFGEKELEEPLKKVFGRGLFSTSTLASDSTKSENLNPQSTSDTSIT